MVTGTSILERIASGDSGAVGSCVDEYGPMVRALALRYLGGRGDEADDAVQEIFIEVWKHASRHDRTRGSEASFIATIAHRRLIDRVRRHGASPVLAPAGGVQPTDAEKPAHAAASAPADVRAAIDAFNQLAPDERQVIRLAIGEGLTHERVASILSVPLGSVKTRIRRGLVRLRELMHRESTAVVSAREEGGQP